MKNGETVRAFEREFAAYVGAKFAIALNSGTSTLHTALVALGVKPGDKVATTPLTMAATSIAILQAGAVPVYHDVNCKDWLMEGMSAIHINIPVSLYGLHVSHAPPWMDYIDDAAQTLRPHNPKARFTSYSFQASKILALGEGGMLVTDSEELAEKARSFSSLGYKLSAEQPRIDSTTLKSPSFERHHLAQSWNYRMNDLTAAEGLRLIDDADGLIDYRRLAASFYREAIRGCSWITPQFVPEGWTHDYWTYAVALESKELWEPFTQAIVRHGGEMPYGAWRLTYHEPAFWHLIPPVVTVSNTINGRRLPDYIAEPYGYCPIAESLQPRLVQFQTNDLASAERNAKAVRKAIIDVGAFHLKTRPTWHTLTIQAMPCTDATGVPCS